MSAVAKITWYFGLICQGPLLSETLDNSYLRSLHMRNNSNRHFLPDNVVNDKIHIHDKVLPRYCSSEGVFFRQNFLSPTRHIYFNCKTVNLCNTRMQIIFLLQLLHHWAVCVCIFEKYFWWNHYKSLPQCGCILGHHTKINQLFGTAA